MIKTKNKKAWAAVIECVLGILVLFAFVIIALTRTNVENQQDSTKTFQELFLNEIENNKTLRSYVLNEQIRDANTSLRAFLSKYNQNYNLNICILDLGQSCSSNVSDKDVISYDYFVTNGLVSRKLKIFIYLKT